MPAPDELRLEAALKASGAANDVHQGNGRERFAMLERAGAARLHNNDATHREATRTTTHTTTTKTTTTSAHRIPDDKYRANFGREHTFHVGHPEVVGGRSRFSYGGYAFYYAEPWPSGWGYDDDVYVVDIDGTYYLMNAAHPGVQLALVIDL